jgi:hypothetical protein
VNRVVGRVLGLMVVMLAVGVAGMAAAARAVESSQAVVLPPVPAAVATAVAKPQNAAAVSPATPAVVPAASATTAVPVAAAQPQATAVAPTAVQASKSVSPAAALPPVSTQPVAQAAPSAAPASHQIYAAVPQNAPAAGRPASVPAAVPSVAVPAAQSPAVKAQPAAEPTAIAAILPPSAAHTDYPRLNGITNGERMHEEDDYAMRASSANWIVRIFKHKHRLEVYYRDNLYKSYHAVFGRSEWPGAKEIENDRRTPEGNYMIVQKHPSQRFDWFLKINYPNEDDRIHFEELRDDGKIPRWAREGGQVGIHGTDNPILNVGDVNWTTGCISIDNSDIDELARLLPIGTVVIIRP